MMGGENRGDEEDDNTSINMPDYNDYQDRDMTEEEKRVLKEFEQNDKELEDIALQIANSLESLGEKAIKTGVSIEEQNQMLKKANEAAERTELELTRQNNELSKLLNKYRHGKQLWLDFFLLFLLMGLIALLYNRLKAKGYI